MASRSCPRIAVVEPHRMPGLGEEQPPLGQQADHTAERRGETDLPVRHTARQPEQRERETQHERRYAQEMRVSPRQLEAELLGEEGPMRMADIEQPRMHHRYGSGPVYALCHADRTLE